MMPCQQSISLLPTSIALQFRPNQHTSAHWWSSKPPHYMPVQCGLRELQQRINTVKNTQKVTEAMKLVAAARVRRAQEAVVCSRPFAESLVQLLYEITERLQIEDVDVPLTQIRPVRKVALVIITGERGLCGSFNKSVLKKAEERMGELTKQGLEYVVIGIGKKGNNYLKRSPEIPIDSLFEGGGLPTAKDAQVIADEVFSIFVSEEVDKVELIYTKFVSLLNSKPVVSTLLPLSPRGGLLDVNGNSVDDAEDEVFKLTTREGKLVVERERVGIGEKELSPLMEFEQDPVQIFDALMPLYLNSQILRALQESLASEVAARMNAMSTATDNAVELNKNLSVRFNRERQAKITGEILEIASGAEYVL